MAVWSDWFSITPYSFIDFGVLLICFALGSAFYIIYYKLGRRSVDLIFANCLACITIMAFGFFIEDNTESPLVALRWARINYSLAALFLALLLHFIFRFLGEQGRWPAKAVLGVYALGAAAVGAVYSDHFYQIRTRPLEPRSWINVSPAFPDVSAAQNVFTVLLILPSVFILFRLYKALVKPRMEGRELRRTKLLFCGVSVLFVFLALDYGLYAFGSICTVSLTLLGFLAFCLCAAVALSEDVINSKRLEEALSKYVSPHVTNEILNKGLRLEGRECEVTVLFSDIRDFTSITHELGPKGITQFLSHYLRVMTEVVSRHDGMLIQTVGDGLLAVFGATLKSNNHELNAVRAGVDMLRELEVFNRDGAYQGKRGSVRIGIGIHSGQAVVGNVGGGGHVDFRVTGDVVNIASRVERFSKTASHPLLITVATYAKIKDFVSAEPAGVAPIKEGELSIPVVAIFGVHATKEEAIDPRENLAPFPDALVAHPMSQSQPTKTPKS